MSAPPSAISDPSSDPRRVRCPRDWRPLSPDRYRLERELGRGGWPRCTWPTTCSTSARSRSRCCGPSWPPALGAERFLREIQIAARLQHPHILAAARLGRARRAALLRHALRRGRDRSGPGCGGRPARRSTRRCGSPGGRRRAGLRPRGRAWSTATSSRRTSCSAGRARAGGGLRDRAGAGRGRRRER